MCVITRATKCVQRRQMVAILVNVHLSPARRYTQFLRVEHHCCDSED